MSSSRGIFGLDEFYNEQTSNKWSTGDWIDASESKYHSLTNHYGYFGGGRGPGNPWNYYSTIDRIDYSNDTANAVTKGPLSQRKYAVASVGNQSFGYWGGGQIPASDNTSRIDRFDYSNDTVGALAKTEFTQELVSLVAVGNDNYGYFSGGSKPSGSPSVVTTIERLDYSNDTGGTAPKGETSVSGRHRMGATGNANYGYFGGGYNDPPSGPTVHYTTVDRLDYSNDTAGAPARGKLDVEVYFVAAAGNSNFGYFGGGSPGPTSRVQRLDYSNDETDAVIKTYLADFPGGVTKQGAAGNSNFGYFGGGYDTDETSKVCRIDYSNDTATASVKGPLTINRSSLSATSSTSNALPKQYDSVPYIPDAFNTQPIGTDYGYFGGGYNNPDYLSIIDRLDYSNDTSPASAKGSLTISRNRLAATGDQNYGYFGGGLDGNDDEITSVDRTDYSNDTATASVRGPLNQKRRNLAAVGNQSYGYFAGGESDYQSVNNPEYSSVERIEYANDTVKAINRGNILTNKVYSFAATGNQNYGYMGGGATGGTDKFSSILRLDYSNDTAVAIDKGDLLSDSISANAATGNANYGYFGSGDPASSSNIDRLDYSNDTSVVTSTSNPIQGYLRAATGNKDYGYWAGGSPGYIETIHRLDYSNDTTVEAKSLLSEARQGLAGASSRANALPTTRIAHRELLEGVSIPVGTDFAYWNLGTGPSSRIERLDYSNDTQIMSFRSSLGSGARLSANAASSHYYGYFAGGLMPSVPGPVSSTERLDYANDTNITVPAGSLSAVKRYHTSAGNQNYGWFVAGENGTDEISTTDRLDYSNDTATALERGGVGSPPLKFMSGVGNKDYGYFSGGDNPPAIAQDKTQSVWRLDYSNDTASGSPRGNVNTNYISAQEATGNANYGYFGGGSDENNDRKSYIKRLDYSNDTATLASRGTLGIDINLGAATGDQNYGYFGGGYTPGSPAYTSAVQRLDYANDTANVAAKGPLSQIEQSVIATSSRESALPTTKILIKPYTFGEATARIVYPYGYFAGGVSPGTILYSLVQRIDYSNDSANALNRGPLTSSKYILAAAGNKNYGYFGGGYIGSSTYVSTVDRIDYANDNTLSIAKGSLLNGVGENAAVGTNNYGYWLGGTTPSAYRSDINRLDYSSDTGNMIQRSKIENDRWGKGMSMGTNNYGYFAGGMQEPSTTDSSRIYRFDYANDTADASLRSSLVINKLHSEGTGNKDYGYIMGGWTDGIGKVSSTDRFNYSNDTAGTIFRGPLAAVRYWHGATGSQNSGYVAGGQDDLDVRSSIERLDYSNDTAVASTKGSLYTTQIYIDNSGISAQENQFASLSKLPTNTFSASTDGYFAGGDDGSAARSAIDRLDYTNDTANTVTKGPLSVARTEVGGMSSKTHGYCIGGEDASSVVVIIDRIDYANDTNTANTTIGPVLINASKRVGTLANANYGYIAGGEATPIYSDIYRLDFSNDSSSLLNRNPAATTGTANIRRFASVGNKDYGYFAGGETPAPSLKKTVFRFDYSNDAVASSPKGDLTKEIYEGVAIGNNYFGYVAGGIDTSPAYSSSIQRIDYSNDTAIAQLASNLSKAKNSLAVTGNRDYGYFGGGYNNPYYLSTIDRLDYSNDTLVVISKGKLSKNVRNNCAFSARQNGIHGDQFITLNAIGNNTQQGGASYGYFGGGADGSVTISNMDRIDYTNDTATILSKGNLTIAKALHGALSNISYGYFAGGWNATGAIAYDKIDRIDYSNDDVNALNRSDLLSTNWLLAAAGNENFGYWIAGNGPRSTIERTDYSNDTINPITREPLDNVTSNLAATGNQNYGYYGGGSTNNPTPKKVSTIGRLDYSNDTATPLRRTNLISEVSGVSATGNKDYGYFAAGALQTPINQTVSTIGRVDYSNDVASITPKATVSITRDRIGATGNKDYGYFGGGENKALNPDVYYDRIDRIDYSNDTVGAPQRNVLSGSKSGSYACSAAENGFPQ